MSTKAIKKELIAALIMTLVAMLALGSSTYAWFANNMKADATGLEVSAHSDSKFMLISETATSSSAIQKQGDTSIKFSSITNTALPPAAYTATVTNTTTASAGANWYTAKALEVGKSDIDSSSTVYLASSLTDYVIHKTVYLTAAKGSNEITGITCTASITNASTGSATDIAQNKILLTTSELKSEINSASATSLGLGKVTDSTVLQVDVFVFVDGNNDKVFTNNVGNLAGIKIDLSFNGAES